MDRKHDRKMHTDHLWSSFEFKRNAIFEGVEYFFHPVTGISEEDKLKRGRVLLVIVLGEARVVRRLTLVLMSGVLYTVRGQ